MQCEQSEYQRQTCRHVDLGEGRVGKKHHDPADHQGQQPAMTSGQIAETNANKANGTIPRVAARAA
jgi:hypothetical protein